jgi:hypothetical protein
MMKSRLLSSSSARAASTNATLDTADASGDLLQEGVNRDFSAPFGEQ